MFRFNAVGELVSLLLVYGHMHIADIRFLIRGAIHRCSGLKTVSVTLVSPQ